MADRIRLIQPDCRTHALQSLFTTTTAADILATNYDGVVDAIDDTPMKALLIAQCRAGHAHRNHRRGRGAARPTAVRVADLARTRPRWPAAPPPANGCARSRFSPRPQGGFWGGLCLFHRAPGVSAADGSVCETREPGANLRLDCRSGYGTACFLTGAFGFAAAARMVKLIIRS